MAHQMSPPTRRHPRPRGLTRGAQTLMLGMITAFGFSAFAAAPAFAIPTTGTVTGTFSVPAGTAAPDDVTVELESPQGYYEKSATVTSTSSTTASYSATGVDPGQYYVYFYDDTTGDNVQLDYYGDGGTDTIQAASLETVTAGNTTALGSTALHAGGTLSGTVSDANSAIESGADVYVYPVIAGLPPDPEFDDYGYEAAVTLATGAWEATGLPPGTYEIEYGAEGTYDNNADHLLELEDVYVGNGGVSYDWASAANYSLSTGSSMTVNFSVPVLGIISGTVSGPHGPLWDQEVYTYDSLGGYGPSTYTATDGTYWMAALPGTYKVEFEGDEAENLAWTWYGGPSEAQATGVNVTAGGTAANINITLGAGGAISGTVVAAQGGAPVGDVEVEVLDAQGNYLQSSYTLPNGSYTVPDLPAGTWYVEFFGGQATNGSFYATGFYGGTLSEFGSTPVTVAAGQTVPNVNGVMLPAGAAALGLPKESAAALSGLHNNKVALKFNVAAGSGAGYLKTLTVGLPKGFSWNRGKLAADLSLGAGVTYTDAITGGKLVITLNSGEPSVAFSLKAGGITVTKAIEKAAGGSTKPKKKTKKKKKHDLAMAAKAKKKKKPAKGNDTIKSETINLSVADTTGVGTSLPITIKKPH
jgi:Carboxypeptidase regulatory-like domain